MKETFYFPHDYGARNDPKLQDLLIAHGVSGLGCFWVIIEQLYEQDGKLPLKSCKSIAFALHMESKDVESIVNDFDLFMNDGVFFWSNSVLARLNKRKEIKEKRKAASLKRWESARIMQEQSNCNANAMQDISKVKESKGKESKENNIKESNKEKSAPRFIPPTQEEVKKYVQENNIGIDAERFWLFYESKGWMIGKNKMKNWHMAVATWAKKDKEERRPQHINRQPNKNCNEEWT